MTIAEHPMTNTVETNTALDNLLVGITNNKKTLSHNIDYMVAKFGFKCTCCKKVSKRGNQPKFKIYEKGYTIQTLCKTCFKNYLETTGVNYPKHILRWNTDFTLTVDKFIRQWLGYYLTNEPCIWDNKNPLTIIALQVRNSIEKTFSGELSGKEKDCIVYVVLNRFILLRKAKEEFLLTGDLGWLRNIGIPCPMTLEDLVFIESITQEGVLKVTYTSSKMYGSRYYLSDFKHLTS